MTPVTKLIMSAVILMVCIPAASATCNQVNSGGSAELNRTVVAVNCIDITNAISEENTNLLALKSDIDTKSAMGVDTSAAEKDYFNAQTQIANASSRSAIQYTDALEDLSVAQASVEAGKRAVDKAWAESEIATAQVPVHNVDSLIAFFQANQNTAQDPRLSTIIDERDSAIGYISLANDEVSMGNYTQARVNAEEAYQMGNESYDDALYLSTPICGDCGPSPEILLYTATVIGAVVLLVAGIFWWKKRNQR